MIGEYPDIIPKNTDGVTYKLMVKNNSGFKAKFDGTIDEFIDHFSYYKGNNVYVS